MHERTVRLFASGNGPFGQVVTIGKHVFGADEPEVTGGMDTWPDPFELLLAPQGACTALTTRM